ncbi:MAG: hypothetical protein RIQ99_1890 [Pseudomonadota bacterium]
MVQTKPAALIYIGDAGRALSQHEHRFVDHRQENAVDDKAGFVFGLHHLLVQAFGKGAGAGHGIGTGRQPGDHFDQAHHRHRVEKVQADEARRIGRTGGHPGDRDRTGVRCHDRISPQHFACGFKNLALDLFALGSSFDDQIGFDHRGVIADRGDPLQRRSGLIRG